jgi:nucleoid-associated protein YgaU
LPDGLLTGGFSSQAASVGGVFSLDANQDLPAAIKPASTLSTPRKIHRRQWLREDDAGCGTASKRPDSADAQPQLAAGVASVLPDGGSPSTVVVSKIATTTVSRGDSLWRLSRQTYGVGTRYAVIYKANHHTGGRRETGIEPSQRSQE